MDLADPGFDHTVLGEFRSRLIAGSAERLLFDVLLRRFRELALLKARGRQRTDATHVLAAVRALNRLELVRETMRRALEVLAEVAPGWLAIHARGDWAKRSQRQRDEWRLPKGKGAQQGLADQIGRDGMDVLTAVSAADAPTWLPEVPAVEMLRRIWLQNDVQTEEGVRFRSTEDGLPPSAQFIGSLYDRDAHLGKKGSTCWIGDMVSLTETCEDDLPNLITHVETTPAPTADGEVTPKVHEDLQAKGLLPAVHLVDTGFLDADLIATSKRDYGVNLLGPTRPDVKWQAKEGTGFDAQRFAIDWERQQATCPAGKISTGWTPAIDKRTNHVIKIKFSGKDCRVCASRDQGIRSTKKVRPADDHDSNRTRAHDEALQARRAEETTPAYAAEECRRAGIEGTISQGVRRCGLRRSRYVGFAKTELDHVLTAAAIDDARVADWFAEMPRAETRRSRFAALMAQPACA